MPIFDNAITLAKFLSFMSGTVTSFVLNRSWTFEVHTKVRFAEVVRFYSLISLSLIVNLVVMSLLTGVLGVYDLVALLITTLFTFGVSFTISKLWVFRKHAPTSNSSIISNS
jgi:putative flippase GtrA